MASRLLKTAAEKEQEYKAKATIGSHKIHNSSNKQYTKQAATEGQKIKQQLLQIVIKYIQYGSNKERPLNNSNGRESCSKESNSSIKKSLKIIQRAMCGPCRSLFYRERAL